MNQQELASKIRVMNRIPNLQHSVRVLFATAHDHWNQFSLHEQNDILFLASEITSLESNPSFSRNINANVQIQATITQPLRKLLLSKRIIN